MITRKFTHKHCLLFAQFLNKALQVHQYPQMHQQFGGI